MKEKTVTKERKAVLAAAQHLLANGFNAQEITEQFAIPAEIIQEALTAMQRLQSERWSRPDAFAVLEHGEGHDGVGWYYWDENYPDEGSVGAFASREDAEAHARESEYEIEPYAPK